MVIPLLAVLGAVVADTLSSSDRDLGQRLLARYVASRDPQSRWRAYQVLADWWMTHHSVDQFIDGLPVLPGFEILEGYPYVKVDDPSIDRIVRAAQVDVPGVARDDTVRIAVPLGPRVSVREAREVLRRIDLSCLGLRVVGEEKGSSQGSSLALIWGREPAP